ncbi:hypothetical protein FISHEDRAFT_72624 [Fistulina hepatica ATCC 64428]|nr:hypothetical protein FISHEDRAFT_72624 [Fistulina hepatica ATCC 64428]
MNSLVALWDNADPALLPSISRVATVIVPSSKLASFTHSGPYAILLDDHVDTDSCVQWLNDGAEYVAAPLADAFNLIGAIPRERLILVIDTANFSAVSDRIRSAVSGVLLKIPAIQLDLIASISKFFESVSVHVLCTAPAPPTIADIRQLVGISATPVVPTSLLSLQASSSSMLSICDAFVAPLVSDRPDGLFPTIVTDISGHSLGLVYSSPASLAESIITGKGVYQSRKHGLWRKGETSGATQDVLRIRLDCDNDALEFRVVQRGAGFCHLNRASCFGHLSGLPALEKTLEDRKAAAPPGSYTKRLFADPQLLHAKIIEEAAELCLAEKPTDVAFEAADLIYFALTKCVSAGVKIADIEASLDAKAKKVTRRPGNAKPQWEANVAEASKSSEKLEASPAPPLTAVDPSAPIRMRSTDLTRLTPAERAQLLCRPVLKSDEMIAKVLPIVEAVRTQGDAALLDFTARFDGVDFRNDAASNPLVIRAPFDPSSWAGLDPAVRSAIDAAYMNVRAFHVAQDIPALRVETMPGVICSRFARPIQRVGLYVPGGTAVLPSTALMLGVPAQAAGCKEIVIATPPRKASSGVEQGSVSPEVMYVAHLVGATAVLRAGGAQAVAALAYGTASVPKVDKIFGPGNQWVTAAKMLVQNDTDALVAIDMPAGPSEVLVIADHTANPAFVAADLLSQAEHGVDSQVVCVTVALPETSTTGVSISAIENEVDRQARVLERVDIVRVSIAKSVLVRTSTVAEALSFSNNYAPEHLILHLENASQHIAAVENAGSVFVGPYSPESCGDYASGTNHTLPTNGYARQFSGVNLLSFQKHITSQEVSSEGLKVLGPIVATLADCEHLQAHANAVRIRLRASPPPKF